MKKLLSQLRLDAVVLVSAVVASAAALALLPKKLSERNARPEPFPRSAEHAEV